MPNSHDQKKKDGERKDKKTHEMHENEAQTEHGHNAHAHNVAASVPQSGAASHATHEHGLQNKVQNREDDEKVNIHSDDKNQRHTHVPKAEQREHDLEAQEAKEAKQ